MAIFVYGDQEINYLKSKDQALAAAIETIGHIEREINPDLFCSLVNNIVGQQISGKAAATVLQRMTSALGEITPEIIKRANVEEIQQFGMSMKKATYIKNAAEKVFSGEFDLEALIDKTDAEVCKELSSFAGIGSWTAEMLMIFSMQRPNILSYSDFGIHKGLRMLYHHRKIDKKLYEKYKQRYSPYATVASLYLWEIAGGAIATMKDYAPKKKK